VDLQFDDNNCGTCGSHCNTPPPPCYDPTGLTCTEPVHKVCLAGACIIPPTCPPCTVFNRYQNQCIPQPANTACSYERFTSGCTPSALDDCMHTISGTCDAAGACICSPTVWNNFCQ
jgi:hypothetical protein